MQFPIPNDGILGHDFLFKNNVIVDVANNKIIMGNDGTALTMETHNNIGIGETDSVTLNLTPRSETIIKIMIADPLIESSNIFIHKQQIIKDVFCSNVEWDNGHGNN